MTEDDTTFTELEEELIAELQVRQQEDAILEVAFYILQKRSGFQPLLP